LALVLLINTPSALTASAVASNQVHLAWTADASVNGFNLQRALDNNGNPGAWTQIATVDSNATSYTDAALPPDTTYWYRVQAFNSCGGSPFSNLASATPPSAPSAPSGLTA